jgi:hypothetical protein
MKSIITLSKRLYIRLSLAFLFLLLIQSVVLSCVWQFGNKAYSQEVTQRLNENIAMYITQQQQLISGGVVNQEELELLADRAMVINPSIEVYVLSKEGVVISNLIASSTLVNRTIDLNAIDEFLSLKKQLPILAQDPRIKGQLKPFSVSPIMTGDVLDGYLYVVLGGAIEQGIIDSIKGSNILSLSLAALFASILLTIIFSVLIFYFMTYRLRQLSVAVRKFQLTNFEDFSSVFTNKHLDKDVHQDEIDQLSYSVLAMSQHMKEQFETIKSVDEQRR